MANKPITMSKIRQILRQHTQGVGSRSISNRSGVSRNTVKKYINHFKGCNLTFEELDALSDQDLDELFEPDKEQDVPPRQKHLEEFFSGMESRLRKVGMTRYLLWEEYLQKHPDGYLYTQFCKRFRDWSRRSNSTMHIIHKAGDKLFVDYAGQKLQIIDKDTGEVIKVEVFIAILGASQLSYIEATASQTKEDFIGAMERSLHYIGGVPAAIITDNLKSAVTKANRYEPTLNECFEDFAEHYQTTALPTRVIKPKDKALVEGVVKILYTRIYTRLDNRRFFNLEDLNKAIWELLEDEHNNVVMQGKQFSRRQLFDQIERDVLTPLPKHRYEMKRYAQVTVMKNGHVHLSPDKHYYSVPYKYIGKKVRLVFTTKNVEVYYIFTRIATHARVKSPYNYTTLKEHMASTHRFVSEWSPDKFLDQAERIHADVRLFIEHLLDKKQHPEQGYKSCMGVLSFAKKAGEQRLISACQRALEYQLYNYKIIENILNKGLDKIDEPQEKETDMPSHSNIRGKDYYN